MGILGDIVGLLGYEPNELIGRHIFEWMDDQSRELVQSRIALGTDAYESIRLIHRKGHRVDVLVYVREVLLGSQRVSIAIINETDGQGGNITNHTVLSLLDQLEEKDRLILDLSKQVVHRDRDTRREILSELACGVIPLLTDIQEYPDERVRLKVRASLDLLGNVASETSTLRALEQTALTHRERRICALIARGYDTKEIAVMLGVATATIFSHRKRIRKKLNLNGDPATLATHLYNNGLMD